MKITDEIVNTFQEAAWNVLYEKDEQLRAAYARGEAKSLDDDAVRAGLGRAALLIVKAHQEELKENAWDGRARGAIAGAIKQLEGTYELAPIGYRPAHEAREDA